MKLVEIVQRYNGKIYMGSFPSEVRPESVTPEAVSTSSVSLCFIATISQFLLLLLLILVLLIFFILSLAFSFLVRCNLINSTIIFF